MERSRGSVPYGIGGRGRPPRPCRQAGPALERSCDARGGRGRFRQVDRARAGVPRRRAAAAWCAGLGRNRTGARGRGHVRVGRLRRPRCGPAVRRSAHRPGPAARLGCPGAAVPGPRRRAPAECPVVRRAAVLGGLVRRLPAHVHLVLASRTTPPVPLAALHAGGTGCWKSGRPTSRSPRRSAPPWRPCWAAARVWRTRGLAGPGAALSGPGGTRSRGSSPARRCWRSWPNRS